MKFLYWLHCYFDLKEIVFTVILLPLKFFQMRLYTFRQWILYILLNLATQVSLLALHAQLKKIIRHARKSFKETTAIPIQSFFCICQKSIFSLVFLCFELKLVCHWNYVFNTPGVYTTTNINSSSHHQKTNNIPTVHCFMADDEVFFLHIFIFFLLKLANKRSRRKEIRFFFCFIVFHCAAHCLKFN